MESKKTESFRLNEKVRFLAESYNVSEENGRVILEGTAITFGKPTRNNVIYSAESGSQQIKSLIGKPFLNSHNDTNVLNSMGHVTEAWMDRDPKTGLFKAYYKVDVDPEEKDFIRKCRRGDIPGVSIQVLVDDIRDEKMFDTGQPCIHANIKEFLELSSVLIPGDGDSTAMLHESLHVLKEAMDDIKKKKAIDLSEIEFDLKVKPELEGNYSYQYFLLKAMEDDTVGVVMGKIKKIVSDDMKKVSVSTNLTETVLKEPFADYANFDACVADQVSKGKPKEDALKICGFLQAKTEELVPGKDSEIPKGDDEEEEKKKEIAPALVGLLGSDALPGIIGGAVGGLLGNKDEKKEDITTGNAGALIGTVLPKKVKRAVEPAECMKRKLGERTTGVASKGLNCPKCHTQMLKDVYKEGFNLRCPKCQYKIENNQKMFKESLKRVSEMVSYMNRFTEAGMSQVPKNAISIKDPSQAPPGHTIIKGPRGGLWAVPKAGRMKPKVKGEQPIQKPKAGTPEAKFTIVRQRGFEGKPDHYTVEDEYGNMLQDDDGNVYHFESPNEAQGWIGDTYEKPSYEPIKKPKYEEPTTEPAYKKVPQYKEPKPGYEPVKDEEPVDKATDTQKKFWGKDVKIHPQLTTDPYNKRGQTGVVTKVDKDGTLHISFSDGTVGKYEYDAVILDEEPTIYDTDPYPHMKPGKQEPAQQPSGEPKQNIPTDFNKDTVLTFEDGKKMTVGDIVDYANKQLEKEPKEEKPKRNGDKIVKKMDDKKLVQTWKTYDDLIHGENPSYNKRDVLLLNEMENELDSRGYIWDDIESGSIPYKPKKNS